MNYTNIPALIHNKKALNERYYANARCECGYLKITAIYICLLFFASLITNTLLLCSLLKIKEMRTPVNTFMIFFTILSLYGTVSELPLVFISMLKCK